MSDSLPEMPFTMLVSLLTHIEPSTSIDSQDLFQNCNTVEWDDSD